MTVNQVSQDHTVVASGPCFTSPDGSLDEPISAGVCHRRSSSTDSNDSLMFTTRLTKRLKLYAMKVAEEKGVPEEQLFEFIDTRGIAYMLIDIKATLIMLSAANRKSLLIEIKELIESKDFKSGLQNCLTACVLSPNLTAYVNDTLEHVMVPSIFLWTKEFMKNNNEIFKVPKFLFEDIELTTQLLKLVSEALSCIRSNVKTKRRCLRIFLIGIGNYKTIPLKDLYSASLLPSLHWDLHIKVGDALGINVELDDLDLDPMMQDGANQVHESSADSTGGNEGTTDNMEGGDKDDGDDNQDDLEGNVSGTTELDPDDSGFGGNRKRAIFTSTKFWKFVDASLKSVRKMARADAEELDDGMPVENIVRNILVEYFQQDLAEFPGRRAIPKLLSSTNPQWQTKIQTDLLWQ
ncbi:hypothetical protein EV424DRAFT_1345690 [Suillus variegatus]|nr:hypothetical protein EV424DRAFT_1345690 [Suillus variegatus]